jgi:hypothetical protein
MKEACDPDRETQTNFGQLPLHLICKKTINHQVDESFINPYMVILSEEGDCFRYLLRLYPAAESIENCWCG